MNKTIQNFHYDELDSTQDEAKRLIQAGKITDIGFVTADSQTNGRGTHGRKWSSPAKSGIYLSVIHLPKEKLALHLHNTGGRALENAEVGLKLGITKFDSSSGGLGGCPYAPGAPGNLATEDLVDFLNKNNIQSGVDLERLSKASLFMQTILGKKLPSKVLQRIAAELCHSRESRNPGNDIIGNDIIKKI